MHLCHLNIFFYISIVLDLTSYYGQVKIFRVKLSSQIDPRKLLNQRKTCKSVDCQNRSRNWKKFRILKWHCVRFQVKIFCLATDGKLKQNQMCAVHSFHTIVWNRQDLKSCMQLDRSLQSKYWKKNSWIFHLSTCIVDRKPVLKPILQIIFYYLERFSRKSFRVKKSNTNPNNNVLSG
jgi:hypothetical protein